MHKAMHFKLYWGKEKKKRKRKKINDKKKNALSVEEIFM